MSVDRGGFPPQRREYDVEIIYLDEKPFEQPAIVYASFGAEWSPHFLYHDGSVEGTRSVLQPWCRFGDPDTPAIPVLRCLCHLDDEEGPMPAIECLIQVAWTDFRVVRHITRRALAEMMTEGNDRRWLQLAPENIDFWRDMLAPPPPAQPAPVPPQISDDESIATEDLSDEY